MSKVKSVKKEKEKRILEIRTQQTGALKQAIEMISNVISDCCIVFIPPDEDIVFENSKKKNEPVKTRGRKKKVVECEIPKKRGRKKKVESEEENEEEDEESEESEEEEIKSKNKKKKNTGGIRVLRLTEDKNILIKMNLDAFAFEYFYCIDPKITIGVDMNQFYALLKTVSDDNPILIYMNGDNRSSIFIRSVNEKEDSSEETDIELFLMDIPNSEMEIPATEFQNKVTMASDKFHTICKHLNNNSTYVEITSIGNQISFRGKSDGGKVTMTYKDPHESIKKSKKKPDQVVQGIYELRNLMCFSRCNKLCHTIDLYLRNDFPLVLVISVATLGKLYIFLTPIENGSL